MTGERFIMRDPLGRLDPHIVMQWHGEDGRPCVAGTILTVEGYPWRWICVQTTRLHAAASPADMVQQFNERPEFELCDDGVES